MSRRELREHIFKFLFRIEFNDREEMPEQEQFFFETLEMEAAEHQTVKIKDDDAAYISNKSNRIIEKLDEIDAMINKQAKGWTTQRMGKVDLTILRLAVYEIVFDEDVPTGVAINEAVELAKRFGQEESSGFVNGVLAKFAPVS
ncbi:MAG: transcription antitermination factor NusB [Lachnospiraceae bacterium]|nr:transcription antitermination factor NusB [Lachnospiraceae bacterium]MDE7183885.1 transcription antitermination factor NusB [Lachnospiraceae bacterium]